jgi:transcriptional regulator with XRE-family HTH domain
MKPITKRLRTLRAGADLSQIETAQRAGLKEYRYWRIESGYSTPSDDEIAALETVFDLRGGELLADIEHEAVRR